MRLDRKLVLWTLNHVPLGPFERFAPRLLGYAMNAKQWKRHDR